MRGILLLILLLVSPLRAQTPSTQPAPESLRILLLHVNDVHGQLEPRTVNRHSVGGYARLATAIDTLRHSERADRIFLIHAGDEFSRGDALATATRGAANVAILNHLGFDFWTLGNGEFYDGLPILKTRIAEARCNVLCANVVTQADGQTVAKPYVIQRVGPLRIAFLGLSFIRTEHPSAKPLIFGDPIRTAAKLLPEIQKQSDAVIAITHLGLPDDMRLAGSVPGIDLVIGGHTHLSPPTGVLCPAPLNRQILVCQAGAYLNYLGIADLTFEKHDGRWTLARSSDRLLPLDDKIPLDPAVTALIARLHATTQPAANPSPALR